ncbi:ATP-binding protein [Bacillus sp. BRMEA1]|uniref:ATP-binding protein n=1 Tax=Neobacillus endophyticus TaxID=2738405 RepID=UPI0015670592|nr:ATP-binding protein [Neobacillus endophyticus]NRD78031.1 ATP-binding protein [Neobacillus endophyticus]
MLAEKLLLNLLITIAPILLCSVLFENRNKSPIVGGLLQSIAALSCMLFSYSHYSFHWDFRYVPLILAILYEGPVSGWMVLIAILGLRLMQGGETTVFSIIDTMVIAIFATIIKKKFWTRTPNTRVLLAILVAVFTLLVCYSSLNIYHIISGQSCTLMLNIPDIFSIGAINILAIAIASRLKEGEIEKAKMKTEIQRAEKLNTLGELAASIAHEVRNPLTVVKGFLQLMQQQEAGKNYEYLSLVLSELGRAETIINDYLNFAKPQFEKIEEFPLQEVLVEIIMLLAPLAVKQGVELESELDSSNFTLITDRNKLKQALVNLIKNAIEATSEGGKVKIHNKTYLSHSCIVIADNGKGMTAEQLARIGTLFYTTKEKGTGLGTSVSIRIIETMSGKVSFESELGVGTKVTLLLPGKSD